MFASDLKDLRIAAFSEMIYTLPSISDKQNDPALVKYSLGNAKDFIKVINSNQLLISPTDNHLGFYTFGLNVVEVH